jgi:hypothetical protein
MPCALTKKQVIHFHERIQDRAHGYSLVLKEVYIVMHCECFHTVAIEVAMVHNSGSDASCPIRSPTRQANFYARSVRPLIYQCKKRRS